MLEILQKRDAFLVASDLSMETDCPEYVPPRMIQDESSCCASTAAEASAMPINTANPTNLTTRCPANRILAYCSFLPGGAMKGRPVGTPCSTRKNVGIFLRLSICDITEVIKPGIAGDGSFTANRAVAMRVPYAVPFRISRMLTITVMVSPFPTNEGLIRRSGLNAFSTSLRTRVVARTLRTESGLTREYPFLLAKLRRKL